MSLKCEKKDQNLKQPYYTVDAAEYNAAFILKDCIAAVVRTRFRFQKKQGPGPHSA